jgi:hypothetical protein
VNRSRALIFATLAAAVCAGPFSARLAAQPPNAPSPAPEIHMLHMGAELLLEDLRAVMNMTTPAEQQYYADLREFLDLSLVGVSRGQPMRMDVLTGPTAADLRAGRAVLRPGVPALRTRTSIPYDDAKEFWEDNLEKNGIEKERQIYGTVYKLKGDVYPYFVRFLHSYAAFAQFLEDLPPVNPVAGLEPLVSTGREMGLYGRNTDPNTEDRRSYFDGPDGVRAAMTVGIIKLKDERQDHFDLRQLMTDVLLDELGRLYVDGREVVVATDIDSERQTARTDMSADPLPGTEFAAAVESAGRAPSRFAAVPAANDTVLSVRLHHPLDAMRQRNAKRLLDQFRTISRNRIRESTDRSAEEKAASNKALDQIYELLAATADAGLGDVFIEVRPAGGRHTLVAGFRTVDGTQAVEILKTIEQTSPQRNVRLGIETAGGVTIHSFDLDSLSRESYRELTGTSTLYVGTSKDVIWLAGGPDAVAALKDAIAQSANDPPEGAAETIAALNIGFRPWLQIRETVEAGGNNKQVVKWAQLALAAARQGDDHLHVRLWRDGDVIRVRADYEAGILRFLGKVIADFSKANLAEQ